LAPEKLAIAKHEFQKMLDLDARSLNYQKVAGHHSFTSFQKEKKNGDYATTTLNAHTILD